MRDIVERLRYEASFLAHPLRGVCYEAAVEIEQLRAENSRLKELLAKEREPEGHRAERVADWLRSHGYTIFAPGPD